MIRKVSGFVLLGVGLLILIVWTDLYYHWSAYSSIMPPAPEEILERQKTIWDWLDLLIIPIVIAGAATIFAWMERRNARKISAERIVQERKISAERSQEAALEAYLAQMSTLLLDKKLGTSEANSEERDIARTWTLTVLRRLSDERKGIVLRVLYESKLITGSASVVSLSGANLIDAHLAGAYLAGINLAGAHLERANLAGTYLVSAHLADAKLEHASLAGSHLERAYLNRAELRSTYLIDAHLASANLEGADLEGAHLARAKLEHANLAGAKLEHAILAGAILARANLEDANLKSAILEGTDLSGAIYTKQTIWPEDFDPVAAGARLVER